MTDDEPAPGRQGGRRARRWAVRIVVVLACLVVAFVVATARLFIWPSTDEPVRSEAVVILSGDFGDRLPAAERLVADGVAPVLVHAGTHDSQRVLKLCRGELRIAAEVVCLRPQPDNTRAEARAVAELARERQWSSLIVVTSKYHVLRAGILFGRCFGGTLRMVGTDPTSGRRVLLKQIPHEWGGLAYLTFERGC